MASEKHKDKDRAVEEPDANRDPITGEPGAHPVGVGLGTAAGGTAGGMAGGALAGTLAAGPIGTVVGAAAGAVIGGVAGGLAGKSAAEAIDPTTEDAYWRENYTNRPYYDAGTSYDEYRPAYQYGWESRTRHQGKTFDQAEADLARDWDRSRSTSRLSWEKAKPATRDAWDRVECVCTTPEDKNRR